MTSEKIPNQMKRAETELLRRRVGDLRSQLGSQEARKAASALLGQLEAVADLVDEARNRLEDEPWDDWFAALVAAIADEGGDIATPTIPSWPPALRNELFGVIQFVWSWLKFNPRATADYFVGERDGAGLDAIWVTRVLDSEEFRTFQLVSRRSKLNALMNLGFDKAVEILQLQSSKPSVISAQTNLTRDLLKQANQIEGEEKGRKRRRRKKAPGASALDKPQPVVKGILDE